ncbi:MULTISPECIES: hypothetical protein [unclassified Dysgonomonas]|nr:MULTISPECIES: hypothetical protein [unclassified Dysgonomonas]
MKTQTLLLYSIFIIIILTLSGCNGKSLYQLEKESLAKSSVSDSIVNGLCFGMNKLETHKTIGWKTPKDNVSPDIDGLRNCYANMHTAFYNDSLSYIAFTIHKMPEYVDIRKKDIINTYTSLYGKRCYEESEEYIKKYIWLKGNLKICFMEIKTPGPDLYVIEYRDLRRSKDFINVPPNQLVSESIIPDGETRDYYPDDNIYTKSYLEKQQQRAPDDFLSKLEQESLATNKRHKNIIGEVIFDMKEAEVWKALGIKEKDTYTFKMKDLDKCKFAATPYFLNDSLISLVFYAYAGGELGYYMNDPFHFDISYAIKSFTAEYGKPAIVTKDRTIWLDGNLKIEITGGYDFENDLKTLRIEYSNLLRKVTEVDILSGKIEKIRNNYFTSLYIYDSRPMII